MKLIYNFTEPTELEIFLHTCNGIAHTFVKNRLQIAIVQGGVCYFSKELSLNSVKLEFGEPNY